MCFSIKVLHNLLLVSYIIFLQNGGCIILYSIVVPPHTTVSSRNFYVKGVLVQSGNFGHIELLFKLVRIVLTNVSAIHCTFI